MVADDIECISDAHAAAPLFALTNIAGRGIAVARWKIDNPKPSREINCSLESSCIVLSLRPMFANGWYGSRKFVSGPVESNSFRVTPAQSNLRWSCDGAVDVLLFALDEETLCEITGGDAPIVLDRMGRVAGPEGLPGPSYVRDDVAANIGRQIIGSMSERSRYASQFIEGISFGLVARLLGRFVEAAGQPFHGGLTPMVLKRVRDHVLANLSNDMRVADLARVSGMSPSHFAHAFTETTGVSPYRYVTEIRMRHAELLLRDEDRTVLSIALDCGFKDPSHFTRAFRSVLGVTPRSYRLTALH